MTTQEEVAGMVSELKGKIRWAIGTSISNYVSWTYPEQVAIASVLSQDILELGLSKRASPDTNWSSAAFVRNQFHMERLDNIEKVG